MVENESAITILEIKLEAVRRERDEARQALQTALAEIAKAHPNPDIVEQLKTKVEQLHAELESAKQANSDSHAAVTVLLKQLAQVKRERDRCHESLSNESKLARAYVAEAQIPLPDDAEIAELADGLELMSEWAEKLWNHHTLLKRLRQIVTLSQEAGAPEVLKGYAYDLIDLLSWETPDEEIAKTKDRVQKLRHLAYCLDVLASEGRDEDETS